MLFSGAAGITPPIRRWVGTCSNATRRLCMSPSAPPTNTRAGQLVVRPPASCDGSVAVWHPGLGRAELSSCHSPFDRLTLSK
jgi:hypothetical protein